MVWNAIALLCMIAARPVTAASMAGTMPSVHPVEANTPAFDPWASAVATV